MPYRPPHGFILGDRNPLHVSAVNCAWHGPIEETKRIGPGIPCCPHCGSVLMQYDAKKWNAGIPIHESKGNTNYGEFMEWITKATCCYPTIEEAAFAFTLETGKPVIYDIK